MKNWKKTIRSLSIFFLSIHLSLAADELRTRCITHNKGCTSDCKWVSYQPIISFETLKIDLKNSIAQEQTIIFDSTEDCLANNNPNRTHRYTLDVSFFNTGTPHPYISLRMADWQLQFRDGASKDEYYERLKNIEQAPNCNKSSGYLTVECTPYEDFYFEFIKVSNDHIVGVTRKYITEKDIRIEIPDLDSLTFDFTAIP
jgi:hypothetical protein